MMKKMVERKIDKVSTFDFLILSSGVLNTNNVLKEE
jgi:hypothetical protein